MSKPSQVFSLLNIVRQRWIVAAACLCLTLLGVIHATYSRELPLVRRTIRIGVDQAAPYQSWAEGRGAVGFTVELLSEAAAKRGIQLEWVNRPEGPGPAYDRHNVDMWPLVSSTWIAKRGAYAPAPFFENQYALAWISRNATAPDTIPEWNGRTIATANLPVSMEMAHRAVPGVVIKPMADRTQALQTVCEGLAEAAFMEVRLLEANLIRRPPGCGNKNFQIQFFHDIRVPMSLAAFPEFKAEADALRDEIELMLQDGRYANIADRWFLFSTLEGHSAVAMSVQRQFRVYAYLMMGAMAVMIAFLVILYRRSRRDKNSAEAASHAKSEFLASVSHEIRTPMNAVLGMTDLLMHSRLTDEQRNYASSISESARLQLSILNDILDSSKIESGKLALENRPFCPAHVVIEVVKTFQALASEQGLGLGIEGEHSQLPERVVGDGRRLTQILSNLVSNAIKFTPSGKITLSFTCVPIEDHARITFAVEDTGIGIAPEAQQSIFESFTQVYSGATRKYGGTGLGLSISRRLAEQMGGVLQLESSPGRGSRFWFEIMVPVLVREAGTPPVQVLEPLQQMTAVAPSPPSHLISALPILVAEDNRVNQRVVCGQLELLGLRHELACNGREAVDKVASGDYGAVLMDCHMPEMDGWEATRRIRALTAGRKVPVIAMTAAATNHDQDAAYEAGMNDFLAKPFTKAELAEVLVRHLPAYQAKTAAYTGQPE